MTETVTYTKKMQNAFYLKCSAFFFLIISCAPTVSEYVPSDH